MKTIKVKTVCGANHASVVLAHPGATPGDYQDAAVQVRQIDNIPDDVSSADVVRLFTFTADVSGLFGTPRLRFDFSELGIGKIVK